MTFNLINCGDTTNSGVNACNLDLQDIQRVIAIPRGFVFPAAALASNAAFLTALEEGFVENSRSDRFFLSPFLTDLDNRTGDPVTENRNNFELVVQYKPFNWMWNMTNVSFCSFLNWKTLMDFQQTKYDYLLADGSGNVWGKNALDSAGDASMGGYSMIEVNVYDFVPKTAAALPVYKFCLKFTNNAQVQTNGRFMAAGFFPTDANGLLGTELTLGVTTNTTTHYYVRGFMGCGASSIGAVYGSTLAAAGAWVLTNVTDNTTITPSAVSYNSALDEYDFTVSAQTTADVINIALAAPSVLTGTPYFLSPAPITETPLSFASL